MSFPGHSNVTVTAWALVEAASWMDISGLTHMQMDVGMSD
jgi:hypothetical protein